MSNETQDSLPLSQFQPLEAILDPVDNSFRLISTISSANFDGVIPDTIIAYPTATTSDIIPGRHILIGESFCIVTRIYENIDPSTTDTLSYEIYFIENNLEKSKTILNSVNTFTDGTQLVVRKDDWIGKSVGESGWTITTEGNSVFSNVAVRGRIEATEGYFDGRLFVGDPLDPDSPGSMRIGTNVDGTLESPGTQDGIHINGTNYWYDSGNFSLGTGTSTISFNGSNILFGTGIEISGSISANSLLLNNGAFSMSIQSNHNIVPSSERTVNQLVLSSSNPQLVLTTSTNHSFVEEDFIYLSGLSNSGGGLGALNKVFQVLSVTPNTITIEASQSTESISVNADNSDTTLTVVDSEGVYVGMAVSGVGIASNTTVTNVTDTIITISNATTQALANVSITFAIIPGTYDSSDSGWTNGTVEYSYDGIYVNQNNYWFSNGLFKIGNEESSVSWNNSTLNVTGEITATSGTIGGFTIGATSLTAGSGSSSVGLAPGTFPFYAGSATPASAPFRVNTAGALTATGATITGAITATTINVGGANGITYDGSTVTIGSAVTINADVTVQGLRITSETGGNVLTIDNNVSGTNDGIYINANNYWYTDGKFSVGNSTNSVVWDNTDLSVTGKIKATSGYIGGTTNGWSINSGNIQSSGGTAKITLDAINAKIYIGTGNHGNANTPFYTDGDGKFSLRDQLVFNPSNGQPGADDFAELTVVGKIRGSIENVSQVPSNKLFGNISKVQINSTTNATITMSAQHAFLTNEFVIIEGVTGTNYTVVNGTYQITSVPSTTEFTITIVGGVISAEASKTGTVNLRELTLGLHPAESGHNAGIGIRLDKNNWWFTNNQFRVGSTESYFSWNGSILEVTGTVKANAGYIGGASGWQIDGSKIFSGSDETYISLQSSGDIISIPISSIVIDDEGDDLSSIYIISEIPPGYNSANVEELIGTSLTLDSETSIVLTSPNNIDSLTDYSYPIQDVSLSQWSLAGGGAVEGGPVNEGYVTFIIYGEDNAQVFIDETKSGLSGENINVGVAGSGIYIGSEISTDAPFSVNQNGILKAASGTIGGFNFVAVSDEGTGGSFVSNSDSFDRDVYTPPYLITLSPTDGIILNANSSLGDATNYFLEQGNTFPDTQDEYKDVLRSTGFTIVDNTGSASNVTMNPYMGIRSESVSALNIAKNGSFEYKAGTSTSYSYSGAGWTAGSGLNLSSLSATTSGYSFPSLPYGQQFVGKLSWTTAASTFLTTQFLLDPDGSKNHYPSPKSASTYLPVGTNGISSSIAVYNSQPDGLFGTVNYVAAYPIKDLKVTYTTTTGSTVTINPFTNSSLETSDMLDSLTKDTSITFEEGYLYLSAPYTSNVLEFPITTNTRQSFTITSKTGDLTGEDDGEATLTIGAHPFAVDDEVSLFFNTTDISGLGDDAYTYTVLSTTNDTITIDTQLDNISSANSVKTSAYILTIGSHPFYAGKEVALFNGSTDLGEGITFTILSVTSTQIVVDGDVSSATIVKTDGSPVYSSLATRGKNGLAFDIPVSSYSNANYSLPFTLHLPGYYYGVTFDVITSKTATLTRASTPEIPLDINNGVLFAAVNNYFLKYEAEELSLLSTDTSATFGPNFPGTGTYDLIYDSSQGSFVSSLPNSTTINIIGDQTEYFPINSFSLVLDEDDVNKEYVKVTGAEFVTGNLVETSLDIYSILFDDGLDGDSSIYIEVSDPNNLIQDPFLTDVYPEVSFSEIGSGANETKLENFTYILQAISTFPYSFDEFGDAIEGDVELPAGRKVLIIYGTDASPAQIFTDEEKNYDGTPKLITFYENSFTQLTVSRAQLGTSQSSIVAGDQLVTIERVQVASVENNITSYYNIDKAINDNTGETVYPVISNSKITNSSIAFDELLVSDSQIAYFDGDTGGGAVWGVDASQPATWSYRPSAVIAQLGGNPLVIGDTPGLSLIKQVSYEPYTYLFTNPSIIAERWDGDITQSSLTISSGKFAPSSKDARIELVAGTSAANNGLIDIDGSKVRFMGSNTGTNGLTIGPLNGSSSAMAISSGIYPDSSYALAISGTNTFISSATGGTTYLRGPNSISTQQIAISGAGISVTTPTLSLSGSQTMQGSLTVNDSAYINVDSGNGLWVRTPAGYGAILIGQDLAANPFIIRPLSAGSAFSSNDLYFNASTSRWIVEGMLQSTSLYISSSATVNSNLVVNGSATIEGNINSSTNPIGTIYASNWFRSTGASGWYNQTYGNGIYSTDTTYVRVYTDSKSFQVGANHGASTARGTVLRNSGDTLSNRFLLYENYPNEAAYHGSAYMYDGNASMSGSRTLYISSTGTSPDHRIASLGSTRRIKDNIENFIIDDQKIDDYLSLSAVTFQYKSAIKTAEENERDISTVPRELGFIAEDAQDKSLDYLYQVDSDGIADYFAYDKMSMYHHEIIKKQQEMIKDLQSRIIALEERI
jgi:hypothetical protein